MKLSLNELKEIQKMINMGYAVQFPNVSIKQYNTICKQINTFLNGDKKWIIQ